MHTLDGWLPLAALTRGCDPQEGGSPGVWETVDGAPIEDLNSGYAFAIRTYRLGGGPSS